MDPFSLPSVTATVSRQQVRALREGESRGIGEAARHAMQQSEKRVLSEAKVPFETPGASSVANARCAAFSLREHRPARVAACP